MLPSIARLLAPLLRLWWPPPPARLCLPRADGPRTPATHPPCPPRPTFAPAPYYRGEDSPLVRPYLLAHERRQAEALRGRARHRTLWLAVHGVDIGPRVVHGREAAA
ncbi:hypothetical protein [Streptomyces tirandamycinicus]|uniref:Uncharacterized protein n=1 Tax=Streptomyces tirandamycinicus TaxID=2174846 RepID=A0A2S1SR58_9ACTN|nr:hypothetical protein [Streptomyces tirandamycinicus]AWI28888.1 hypothetical protein DDW44_08900 [Streptomyces tirandamycinicus]